MKINSQHIPALYLTAVLPITLLGLLLLGGCASVGPDYVRPDVSVSDQWHTALKGGLKPAAADPGVLAAWWTTLNDEA
ncbi:MAG TPA: hypothetical protein PKN85_08225, partial [Syntrophorhabdaceae bacterium]|nr:hypothetical protein [Syntrophorhabdaceae bacterium]